MCDQYGVEVDIDSPVGDLAVGQQQWVEILKAIYLGVEILILDEPTAVLTPEGVERLFATLRRMTSEGLTIVLITHKLHEVMEISDDVTVLRRGRVVRTARTSDVGMADLTRMMVGRDVALTIDVADASRGALVLEVSGLDAATDSVIEDGHVRVLGSPVPTVTIAQVATAAIIRTLELPPGVEPGLEATARFEPDLIEHVPDEDGRINPCAAYANAAHAAVIRVDVGTGGIEILDYILAHDCGRVINPPIVDGQIRGGIAQGIGGTLYEDLRYSDFGQPQTAFMDYLVPSAIEMPDLVIEHFESPSPNTPLGIKAREAGQPSIGPLGTPAS